MLTFAGEFLVVQWDLFPLSAGEEARTVDNAFRTLVILAVPVLVFVVVTLVYSTLRFRSKGEPSQDGPPIRTHGAVIGAWFLVTGGLTVFMIINPGIAGMTELSDRARHKADLVVRIETALDS